MSYTVETTKRFDREFKKLDRYTKRMLKSWIEKRLIDCDDPRQWGKALSGTFKGLWRYRIGEYRFICDIQDEKLVILALSIGHRREIYKSKR
ncbi:MAG: type II toxin-antitoxin system RelE/ParE family toxin [Pseudoramibacter sp.]|jgi:mRNA interferase RelE/StbE